MWSVEGDESGPTGTARVLYMKNGGDLSWSAGRSCAGCLSEPDRAVGFRGEMIAEGIIHPGMKRKEAAALPRREKCHQNYKHEHKGGGHKQPLAGALRYGFAKPATQPVHGSCPVYVRTRDKSFPTVKPARIQTRAGGGGGMAIATPKFCGKAACDRRRDLHARPRRPAHFASGFELTLEPERPPRRIEVINGAGGRRRWSADDKARILEETLVPGAVVSEVARRHGLTPQQLFGWRREGATGAERGFGEVCPGGGRGVQRADHRRDRLLARAGSDPNHDPLVSNSIPSARERRDRPRVRPQPSRGSGAGPGVQRAGAARAKRALDADRASGGLPGRAAGRRLWRLQGHGGARRGAPGLLLVACARRFYELASAGPAPIASEALIRIADLYLIESEIRGCSAAERRTIRQERSRSLVQAFELWLREKLALVSQKSTRGNPICALAMDGVEPLPRRRPHRDRFERATVAPGIPTFDSPVRLGV